MADFMTAILEWLGDERILSSHCRRRVSVTVDISTQLIQERRKKLKHFHINKKRIYPSLLVTERITEGCTSGRRKRNLKGMRCKKEW